MERVFGSPGHEFPQAGELCAMSSSYPSMKDSPTLTQGGVLLVKLGQPLPTEELQFVYVTCPVDIVTSLRSSVSD